MWYHKLSTWVALRKSKLEGTKQRAFQSPNRKLRRNFQKAPSNRQKFSYTMLTWPHKNSLWCHVGIWLFYDTGPQVHPLLMRRDIVDSSFVSPIRTVVLLHHSRFLCIFRSTCVVGSFSEGRPGNSQYQSRQKFKATKLITTESIN